LAFLTGLLIFISVYTFEKIEPIKTGDELPEPAFFTVKSYEKKEKTTRKPMKGKSAPKLKINENDTPATTKKSKPKSKKLKINTSSTSGSAVLGLKEFLNHLMSFEEPKFIVIAIIVAHILYLLACILFCIGVWKVYINTVLYICIKSYSQCLL